MIQRFRFANLTMPDATCFEKCAEKKTMAARISYGRPSIEVNVNVISVFMRISYVASRFYA